MRNIMIAVLSAALFIVSGSALANGQNGYGYGGKYVVSDSDAESKSKSQTTIDDHSTSTVDNDFPAAQAWAPPLTSADDTCMGSTSGGVQTHFVGISGGSTWRDEDCVRRKDARLLNNMGLPGVAMSLMCQKPEIAQAATDAGVPCAAESTEPVGEASASTTLESGSPSRTEDPEEWGWNPEEAG